MTKAPDLPYQPEGPVLDGGPRLRSSSPRPPLGRRHIIRIALVVLGIAIYLPAAALMVIQVGGALQLQALFDWLTGQCGAGCNGRIALATAIQITPIILTAPVLIWIAILWVLRGKRSDREVGKIAGHFETAPDRVSPHAIEEEEERYLYRDRRGRLRPVHAPPPSAR